MRHLTGFSAALVLLSSPAQAAFQSLGFLSEAGPSPYTDAFAISADGSTVSGVSTDASGKYFAVRWTEALGFEAIPQSLPNAQTSLGQGISADGSIVLVTEINQAEEYIQSFRWSQGGGLEPIPHLNPGPAFSLSTGISGDGNTIAGSNLDGIGYVWTSVTGTVALPLLADQESTNISGISSNGSTVIGYYHDDDTFTDAAFRWTAANGSQYLTIPDSIQSAATAASANGSTIVGAYLEMSGNSEIAFAWTELGVVTLSALSMDSLTASHALAVTRDGKWAVGESGDLGGSRPVIWDTETGQVYDIQALIAAQGSGSEMADWTSMAATGISDDGKTIVGFGVDPQGRNAAWRVTLDTIPEPSALAMIVLGSGAFAFRRRKNPRC